MNIRRSECFLSDKWICLIAVSVLVLSPMIAGAQSDNAQISGFIRDHTGAVIPGAKIAVQSESKGIVRTTASNAQGYYVMTDLAPDYYTVTVEQPGFKRFQISRKKLDPS